MIPENDNSAISLNEALFATLITASAVITILTHLLQLTDFASFRVYAWACVIVIGVVVVVGFRYYCFTSQRSSVSYVANTKVTLVLVFLGSLSAVLALATNRGSIDDPLYVADAVYRLQHPSDILNFSSHYLYNHAGRPFLLYWYDTANAFEYAQAAIAYLLGLEFLTLYHIVAVALFAFIAPLAVWFLLRQFISDPWACLAGTIFSFGILLILGETHRAYGNFFITRIFHGKTVLMAIGLPLVAAYTVRFLHTRSRFTWWMLLASTTATTGLTTSSFVLVPALVSVLLLAHGWAARPSFSEWIRDVAWVSIALGYLFICAVVFSAFALKNLGIASIVNVDWPLTFSGHFRLVFDVGCSFALIIFSVCMVVAGIFLGNWQRQLLFGWMAASILLYLNPLTAPFLIEHLTSPNIYWRLFYIFPFIATIGLAGASTWQVLSRFGVNFQSGCAGLVIVALIAAHFLLPSASIFKRHDVYKFGPIGYKLPNEWLTDARKLIATAPPGPMLAPEMVAGTIAMLNSHFPQIRVRDTTLLMLMAQQGLLEEAKARIRASEFVAGDATKFESFKTIMEIYSSVINSVVLDSSIYKLAAPILDSYGFNRTATVGRWTLVISPRQQQWFYEISRGRPKM